MTDTSSSPSSSVMQHISWRIVSVLSRVYVQFLSAAPGDASDPPAALE